MRALIGLTAALALTAACGDKTEEKVDSAAADAAVDTSAGAGLPGMGGGPAPVEIAAAPIQTRTLRLGQSVLNNPSDPQFAMAYYQIAAMPMPLDRWASQDNRVTSSNEFDRPEVLATVKQELSAAAAAVDGVGFVKINTDMSFGEYDHDALGYRLSGIENDRYYHWNYRGGQYRLTMENGDEARLWRLPPADARAILERVPNRYVSVVLTFKIVDAVPDGSGGILKGRIVSYDIYTRDRGNSVKLGTVAVPGA